QHRLLSGRVQVAFDKGMIRSAPDGYTLLLTNPTNAINATFYAHLNYDFLHDSDPVAGIMRVPNVMVVGAAVPANSVPEFIAYAKANPGKVYYAARPRTCLRNCSS